MNLQPLVAKIEADVSGFVKATREAERESKKFEAALGALGDSKFAKQLAGQIRNAKLKEQLLEMGATTKTVGNQVTDLAAKMYILTSTITRGMDLAGKAFKGLEDAARTMVVTQFFEQAGKDIRTYREATAGLISDADLMKKANTADSMGLSEQTFLKLAKVAQAASAKTGQSFDHMFESIILGTARSSRLLLDNLGIIVSVDEANRHYVEGLIASGEYHLKVGETVDKLSGKLTDEAKKLAFVEEVTRKSAGMSAEFDQILNNQAATFDRLRAAADNFVQILLSQAIDPQAGINGYLITTLDTLSDMIPKFGMVRTFALGLMDTLERVFHVGRAVAMLPLAAKMAGGAGAAIQQAWDAPTIAQTTMDSVFEKESALLEQRSKAEEVLRKNGKSLANALWDAQSGFATLLMPELVAAANSWKDANSQLRPYGLFDATVAQGRNTGKAAGTGPFEAGGGDKGPKGPKANKESGVDGLFPAGVTGDQFGKAFAKLLEDAAKAEAKRYKEWNEAGQKVLDMTAREHEARQELLKAMAAEAAAYNTNKSQALQEQAAGGISSLGSGNVASLMQGLAGGLPVVGALLELLAPAIQESNAFKQVLKSFQQGLSNLVRVGVEPFLRVLLPLGPSFERLGTSIGLFFEALFQITYQYNQAVVVAVDVLSKFITVLTGGLAIMELIWDMALIPFTILNSILDGVFDKLERFGLGLEWTSFGFNQMVGAAVNFNNGLVEVIRGLGDIIQEKLGTDLGLKDFGQKLYAFNGQIYNSKKDELKARIEAEGANTDATVENTKAVNNLAQEIRNMPAGYKANYAMYQSQNDLDVEKKRGEWLRNVGNFRGGGISTPADMFRGRF